MSKSDMVTDQAAGLRRMFQHRPVQVMAVASGKGGVGKTNVSINLSVAMSAIGKEVILLDADMGLANVDVLLGLQSSANLSHVLDGKYTLEQTIIRGPAGLNVIPASSGIERMANLSSSDYYKITQAFAELSINFDVLVIDIAAGVSDSVINFSRAAQEIVVVVCDEPASITDAYALIKVLSQNGDLFRFHVVSNMVQHLHEGRILYHKLAKVCQRFLGVTLHFMGTIPYDPFLRKAVQRQNSVVQSFPGCPAARAFRKMALTAAAWPLPEGVRGQLGHFAEKLSAGASALST